MKKLSIIKQMLKATLLTILVVFNSYDLYSQTQLEDAQDATLTDLDGNTETIYELLAQNYVVILMHGKIVNQYIVDGLGKKHAFTDLHTLPEGVYFEIQQFEDGSILTKKLFNKHQ